MPQTYLPLGLDAFGEWRGGDPAIINNGQLTFLGLYVRYGTVVDLPHPVHCPAMYCAVEYAVWFSRHS